MLCQKKGNKESERERIRKFRKKDNNKNRLNHSDTEKQRDVKKERKEGNEDGK